MGICLSVAASGMLLATLPAEVTLAWMHSVEKTRWEEDYRARAGVLELVEDRIEGFGAGMEPPEGARFDGRWWRYRPPVSEFPYVLIAVGDGYELCRMGRCTSMRALIGETDAVIRMAPC